MATKKYGKGLNICKPLHSNRRSRIRCIKESIAVKKYYINWYNCLLGIRVNQQNWRQECENFETQDAELQQQIELLLDAKAKLRYKFENGETVVAGLHKEIDKLCIDEEVIRKEAPDAVKLQAKINRYNKLKERLKVVEDFLKDKDINVEELIRSMEQESEQDKYHGSNISTHPSSK